MLTLLTAGWLAFCAYAQPDKTLDDGRKQDIAESADTVAAVKDKLPDREAADSVAPRRPGTVGLVLSGGGAKGIAHVGVIKALEDNGIPIDYVTGTSMGAIVGSLYSCGWSPQQMLDLFTSKEFLDWSTGTIPKDNIYYYIQPIPIPAWLEVNINFNNLNKKKLTNQLLPTSIVSPLPMNIEFLRLYGPYSEQCGENFNNLMVPFRCVASDVYHKHKVVLSKGSLGDAVRASMSFPLVFRPIKLNGVLMYDGGIYDNFPVNVMESDFNPEFIIGVSVSGADSAPKQGDVYSQVQDMIVQNNDYSLPADKGVKIQVPVTNFGVLQFDKGSTIYEIGYKTGLAMVDSIKSRISMRRSLEEVTQRRAEFASETPKLIFDTIKVTGANADQSRYLKFLFTEGESRPIGIDRTVKAYYRAVTDGTLNNLLPQAIFGKDGRNTLLLEASVKRPWTLGVGGWITSSTNSMLFLTVGYHTLSFNSLNLSLSGWVGQSYFAGLLTARFTLPSRVQSLFEVQGLMSRQKYYDSEILFYETDSPAFITEVENYLRGSYIWAVNKKVKGWLSLAGGYISDSYFPDSNGSYQDRDKDKTQYRLGIFRGGVEKNTLNNMMYPSAGVNWKAELNISYEQSRFLSEGRKDSSSRYRSRWWGSVSALWKHFFKTGDHFTIGAMANGMFTLKKLQQNYTSELIHAYAFAPTPSTRNYFNEAFRSDNYLAAGVIPMWTPFRRFQIRGDFYAYAPMRALKNNGVKCASYGKWFDRVEFIGEVAVVYNFSFASLSAYANYLSYPARNWNFGINFGLYFQAPKLIH